MLTSGSLEPQIHAGQLMIACVVVAVGSSPLAEPSSPPSSMQPARPPTSRINDAERSSDDIDGPLIDSVLTASRHGRARPPLPVPGHFGLFLAGCTTIPF